MHLDGPRDVHDHAVARGGIFDVAVAAIKAAKARGFRVTTNTTIFDGADPATFQSFFDYLTDDLKVDGMMISPGYRYEKAPDQDHFLAKEQTRQLFRAILAPYKARKNRWQFNASPFFLDFLTGEKEYDCTPWGMPSYSLFGWQKPCYLLGEGYANSYKELLEDTEWEKYGHASGNPKCEDCMVHSGFEATAAADSMRPRQHRPLDQRRARALGFGSPTSSEPNPSLCLHELRRSLNQKRRRPKHRSGGGVSPAGVRRQRSPSGAAATAFTTTDRPRSCWSRPWCSRKRSAEHRSRRRSRARTRPSSR